MIFDHYLRVNGKTFGINVTRELILQKLVWTTILTPGTPVSTVPTLGLAGP